MKEKSFVLKEAYFFACISFPKYFVVNPQNPGKCKMLTGPSSLLRLSFEKHQAQASLCTEVCRYNNDFIVGFFFFITPVCAEKTHS